MILQKREKDMMMAYILQNITNGYLSLVQIDAKKTNPNNNLYNRVTSAINSTQKIFTPIDVQFKKSECFESVFGMIQDYADIIERVNQMSHDQILKLKETENFK